MKKINFLSVRSVRETSDRQSSPAFARDLNHVSNIMMSFGRWVTSPLTAVFFNASLRMKMPSRLACSVVLTGLCGLVLAGCGGTDSGGGNGGDGRGNPNPRAVSDVQTTVSGNTITVSWDNPNRENIIGFNMTWFNVDDKASDGGTKELDF